MAEVEADSLKREEPATTEPVLTDRQPSEWTRHFTWRCHQMSKHGHGDGYPLPCPSCFSIETINRRVPFVAVSERGFGAPGDPVTPENALALLFGEVGQ